MAATVYIDLSAKVEQWMRDSAVAMASGEQSRTILVSSSIKRRIRDRIRELYGRKSDQYRLLALLIYLTVRNSLSTIEYIVIDRDYGGSHVSATITNFLLILIQKDRPNATASMIRFDNIKGSRADKLAKQVYDGEITPDHSPKYEEIARHLGK